MKTAKTIMLAAIASLLLVSCSNSDESQQNTESTDLQTNNENASSQTVNDDISADTPESEIEEESEIDDGDEPMTAIYYKKLYADFVTATRYDGPIAELDYSLLDGYSFVGILSTKFENYKEDGKWVMPDAELTSNYFEEGDALLYSEEKDNFLVWSQTSNYMVTITQFPMENDSSALDKSEKADVNESQSVSRDAKTFATNEYIVINPFANASPANAEPIKVEEDMLSEFDSLCKAVLEDRSDAVEYSLQQAKEEGWAGGISLSIEVYEEGKQTLSIDLRSYRSYIDNNSSEPGKVTVREADSDIAVDYTCTSVENYRALCEAVQEAAVK